ncbi:MAG: hypothetical protein MRY74_01555 [Neomegalonema sp.]|nr:hypothetical protein [Neomegalonema sp.]
MRFLAYIFFLLALAALGLDVWAMVQSGDPFAFRQLGQVWYDLHPSSLQTLQPAIERHIHEDLYAVAVRPVLLTPAVYVFGVLFVVFRVLSALIGLLPGSSRL